MSKRQRRAREKQHRHRLAASGGLAVAATLASGGVAQAGILRVDTTTDDGSLTACTAAADDCSLRGAITNVNSNPSNSILFASGVTGSIVLDSDLPKLTAGETIQGPGADALTIDANHHAGFYADTTNASVGIADLTVANASGSSGGFYSKGSSTNGMYLTRVAATGEGASNPAVAAYTPLLVYASTISGNAGTGIAANDPHTTIKNSTVAGNAKGGAYLLNGGVVANSTISANGGYGVRQLGGLLYLDSSIVSGNTASDILQGGGTVHEHFSLVQNASGLSLAGDSDHNLNGQDPQLGSVADNGGPTQTIKPAVTSPVIDAGKDSTALGKDQRGVPLTDDPAFANVSDGRDIGAFEVVRPVVTGLSATSGHHGNAITISGVHFSQATSVKFGDRVSGFFTYVTDDQLTAVAPPGSGTVDVTVTNSDGMSPIVAADKFTFPDPRTFEVDNTSDDGSLSACTSAANDCSLRGALTDALDLPDSTVTFAATVTGTIAPVGFLPNVYGPTQIKGPGAGALTIDATQSYYLNVNTQYGPVSLSGLTISGSNRGAIDERRGTFPLSLTDMVLSGNTRPPFAGGVYAHGSLMIDRSTISGNSGASGVVESNGPLTLTNSTVAGNPGTDGIQVDSGGATIRNSTVAANGGRGIDVKDGALTLQSSIVAGNTGADVQTEGIGTVTENFGLVQNPTGLTLQPGSGNNLNGQDPLLGALADNGGPTKTMKPSVSGPVIDAGKDFAGSGHDQRGMAVTDSSVPNAADGRDVGAVESAPPQVSSLSPDHGAAGTSVTIAGTNFGGTSAVKFGTADAASFSVVAGTVTAVAPAGSGTVDVTVAGPDGTGATDAADKFTYEATQPPPPATDAEILKKLKRGVLSARFVKKNKALVFGDRLPEAGKASYTLRVAHKKKHKTKQLKLGTRTVTVTGAKTAHVTIRLGKKRWLALRHNPKGKLSLLTSFKRKLNGHLLKITRGIKPKHRPTH